MIKNVVLILTTLLLLAGCSWGKYSEPKYYDLTTPEPLPALKYPIQIKNFGNNTAVKQRMNVILPPHFLLQTPETEKAVTKSYVSTEKSFWLNLMYRHLKPV